MHGPGGISLCYESCELAGALAEALQMVLVGHEHDVVRDVPNEEIIISLCLPDPADCIGDLWSVRNLLGWRLCSPNQRATVRARLSGLRHVSYATQRRAEVEAAKISGCQDTDSAAAGGHWAPGLETVSRTADVVVATGNDRLIITGTLETVSLIQQLCLSMSAPQLSCNIGLSVIETSACWLTLPGCRQARDT